MRSDSAIVIFARHPTPGHVKTRLARDTGPGAAAAFYRFCAEHVIRQALSCAGCTCYLFYSEPGEDALVQGLVLRPQLQSAVLGERMHAAMAWCLAQGHRKAMIIGTDVPELDAAIMARALAAADEHQLAFGPAEDGGYYLLAATAVPAELFAGIAWSTEEVLVANVANAQRLGLSVAPLGTLPTLADIDTVADLEHWVAGCQARGAAGGPVPPALQAAAAAALAAARERRQRGGGG